MNVPRKLLAYQWVSIVPPFRDLQNVFLQHDDSSFARIKFMFSPLLRQATCLSALRERSYNFRIKSEMCKWSIFSDENKLKTRNILNTFRFGN